MTEQTVSLLTGLERRVAAIAAATSASEVFRHLLESSHQHAPRTCLFLMREGRFKGWGCLGHAPEVAGGFAKVSLPPGAGWLGRLASDPDISCEALAPGEEGPSFGQDPSSETLGFPIRLGGSPAAILVVERSGAEEPWEPDAIAVLAITARLRLELDLVWRRQRSAGAERAVKHAEPAPPAPQTPPSAGHAPAPSDAAAETSLTLAPEASAPAETNRQLDEARRYAKLVATDVRLYNEEAVATGRREGDLAKRLWVHLLRGREAFLRRFPDLGDEGLALLREAYVQVLAGGDASLLRVSKDLSTQT